MTPPRAQPKPPVTVPIAFVNGMLSGVVARGEDISAFLQDARIGPELLQQLGARVTAGQYVLLFRSLIERRDDDMLGFLSRPLRRGSVALITRAAVSARTLESAMSRAAHTFGLLQDDLMLEPVRDAGQAGWALRFRDPLARQPAFLHELLLRFFWRLLAWLAGGRLPAVRVDFAFPPPSYAGSYGPIFPAPLLFERPQSAFWIDPARLADAVRRDEAALRAFLADAQSNVIVPKPDVVATKARVREYLQRSQPGWPGLPSSAEALHMSPATLQRHLAAEGTTFQALKDDLRRDLAITRLGTSSVALTVLAGELGFSDSASFQRAFKNWTGSAPGIYRRVRRI